MVLTSAALRRFAQLGPLGRRWVDGERHDAGRRLMERLDELALSPTADDPPDGAHHFGTTTDAVVVRGTKLGDRWAHLTVYDRRHQLLGLADAHAG